MADITIALLDPQVLFRNAIASLINSYEGYTVSIQAGCYEELLEQMHHNSVPQVLLLSIALPGKNGYEATRLLLQQYPAIKVIALCGICTPFSVRYMVECGACGYLTKSSTPQQVHAVLSAITAPGFECYGIGGLVAQRVLPAEVKSADLLKGFSLSNKEIRFLQLCCGALTYQQMEQELYTSKSCIDKMREKLCEKLNMISRQELAVFALVNGLRTDLIPYTFQVTTRPVLQAA